VVVEHATSEQALPHPETVHTYEDLTRELNILRIAAHDLCEDLPPCISLLDDSGKNKQQTNSPRNHGARY
jgi:hypothetical protein